MVGDLEGMNMISDGKFEDIKKLAKKSYSIDEAKLCLVELQKTTEKLGNILYGFDEFNEYLHDLVEAENDLFNMASLNDAKIRAEISELLK